MAAPLSDRHRKWFGWFSLLARFASVQMVIHVLGFLSGILIVRHLSKLDYAWFTIANTFVATLGMLADSGVSAALSSVGGKIWQDNARFGSLIRTALGLRNRLAVATVIVVTPLFVWLLAKNQAPVATVGVLVVAALAGFSLQLTAGVLGVVISLRQEIRRMQRLGLVAAVLRFALVASVCRVFFDARVAVMIGVCGPALHAWFLRRWVKTSVEWDAPESPAYRDRVLAVVKQQAPLTIFYCLQGQIIVWLISVFGSEERVAEIGALGRFAMIFTVASSVMNGIVVPRFSEASTLRSRPDILASCASFFSAAAWNRGGMAWATTPVLSQPNAPDWGTIAGCWRFTIGTCTRPSQWNIPPSCDYLPRCLG
jgi:O-antigen/teichoic acid export membrane protein